MRTRRRAGMLCSLAAVALFSAACGDDPSEAVGAGAEAPVEDLASTLPPAGGTGTGVVTLAAGSYGFDADVCALTPVSHEGTAYDLYVHGEGTMNGTSFELEVLRTAGDDGTRIEQVNISYGEGRIITANNLVPEGRTQDKLAVSDTLLSGAMEFDSSGNEIHGEGQIDLTCG
jgi:hypothetical protein